MCTVWWLILIRLEGEALCDSPSWLDEFYADGVAWIIDRFRHIACVQYVRICSEFIFAQFHVLNMQRKLDYY